MIGAVDTRGAGVDRRREMGSKLGIGRRDPAASRT